MKTTDLFKGRESNPYTINFFFLSFFPRLRRERSDGEIILLDYKFCIFTIDDATKHIHLEAEQKPQTPSEAFTK